MSLLIDRDEFRRVLNTAPTVEVFGNASGLAFSGDYVTTTSTSVDIDDIVEEKIEQYKELMRLQALGCKNCGGSIDKATMICEYCGTRYRN